MTEQSFCASSNVIEEDERFIRIDDDDSSMPPEEEYVAPPPDDESPEGFLKSSLPRRKSERKLRRVDSTPSTTVTTTKGHRKTGSGSDAEDDHHKKKKRTRSVYVVEPEAANSASSSTDAATGLKDSVASNGSSCSGEDSSSPSDSSPKVVEKKTPEKTPSKKFNTLSMVQRREAEHHPSRTYSMSGITAQGGMPPQTPPREGSKSARPVLERASTPTRRFRILSRTFSDLSDLTTPTGSETNLVLNQAEQFKAIRELIGIQMEEESTPKGGKVHTIKPSKLRAKTNKAIIQAQTEKAQSDKAAAASSGQPITPSSMDFPSIGTLAIWTEDKRSDLEQRVAKKRENEHPKATIIGGTVDEQALQPGHDGNPHVAPFVAGAMTKLRSYGKIPNKIMFQQFWTVDPKAPETMRSDLQTIEERGMHIDTMVIEREKVLLMLIFYLEHLSKPLISFNVQNMILPAALAGYKDKELAAAILAGMWAMTNCEFETLKHIVFTMRDLFMDCTRPSVMASQSIVIGSALSTALFQNKSADVKVAMDQIVSCILRFADDLFYCVPEMVVKPTSAAFSEMVITAATPAFLIEMLTNEFYEERYYSFTFLLTYQYFFTHEELYDALVTHYRQLFKSKEDCFVPKKRLISCAVVRWFRLRGIELFVDSRETVVEKAKQVFGALPADNETGTLRQQLEGLASHVPNYVIFSEKGDPVSCSLIYSLLSEDDVKLKKLAEQLCLFQQKLLTGIPISEFTRKKKRTAETSESDIFLESATNSVNMFTQWLVTQLARAADADFGKLVCNSIKLANLLLQYNNFGSAFAVCTALQHPLVERRMKNGGVSLPKKIAVMWDDLMKFGNPNMKEVRTRVSAASPPGVPVLPAIQHDLGGLEEVFSIYVPNASDPNRMVNFDMLRKVGDILQQVKLFQLTPYKFKEEEGIQTALTKLPYTPNDDLYARKK